MEYLSQDNVRELVETECQGPAVTIYLPMTTAGSSPQIAEYQIRFKDAIKEAVHQLSEHYPESKVAKELKANERVLMQDGEFWKNQTPGLLLCASEGMFRMFHLPYETEAFVSVNSTLFLAPVLSIMSDAREYYVLSVVQQKPKLFKGDLYGLREAELSLPADIRSALNLDETNQKSENQASAGMQVSTGSFNGRGGAKNPLENDRMQYFRIIDNLVNSFIHGDAPLILAGIDAEVAQYRAQSKYPNILKGCISGSYGDAQAYALAQEAEKIMEEEVIEPMHEAAAREYENMHGAFPERTADNKADILEAAEQGRVDKLLVRMTRGTMDAVKETLGAAKRITFPEPELSEILNQLAIKVWTMSGSVIGLSTNEMPNGAPMLARLRY